MGCNPPLASPTRGEGWLGALCKRALLARLHDRGAAHQVVDAGALLLEFGQVAALELALRGTWMESGSTNWLLTSTSKWTWGPEENRSSRRSRWKLLRVAPVGIVEVDLAVGRAEAIVARRLAARGDRRVEKLARRSIGAALVLEIEEELAGVAGPEPPAEVGAVGVNAQDLQNGLGGTLCRRLA